MDAGSFTAAVSRVVYRLDKVEQKNTGVESKCHGSEEAAQRFSIITTLKASLNLAKAKI
jgi:hypothetical protein